MRNDTPNSGPTMTLYGHNTIEGLIPDTFIFLPVSVGPTEIRVRASSTYIRHKSVHLLIHDIPVCGRRSTNGLTHSSV
uniref:Uncharacterized protein n=1 Tax=Panagrellus redivivus TaxID=6233 RepID=A0A7E4VRA2_PANRE